MAQRDSLLASEAAIALENARLRTEHREALDRQTATVEVLEVINASPGDLVPVFDAILEKAHALCRVAHGSLQLFDGTTFRAVAVHSLSEPLARRLREGYVPGPRLQGLMDGADFMHIVDMAEIDDPVAKVVVEGGIRSLLAVALRKDGKLLGQIVSARNEVQPFSDKEIALLQSFAAQAVIAMENARLLTEQREALEQQTATAEVLRVINASPGELAAVFDAILEKAMRLCGASFGILRLWDGSQYQGAASRGVPTAYGEFLAKNPQQVRPGSIGARILAGERVVHVIDVAQDKTLLAGDPHRRALAELGGARTSVVVPLTKDNKLLGALQLYRQHVQAFSEKQIALLRNFAAQAEIAIENARLLTEQREALEQQTAAAQVLEVINASPGVLAPVFDIVLEKAMQLCGARFGHLDTYDGKSFHTAAARGVPAPFADYRLRNPSRYGPGTGPAQMLAGARILYNHDLKDEDIYRSGEPNRRALVDLGGARSAIQVALRKDDVFLGFITLFRQEVRPFTEKQGALVQNFANQAVIAMENARLLTDLQQRTDDLTESLEYQTATSEVLRTISRSSTDLGEVLETLLGVVARLCRADQTYMFRRHGEQHQLVATHGVSAEGEAFIRANPLKPERGTTSGRVAMEKRIVHIHDVMADPEYDHAEGQGNAGFRTMLGLPLLREDNLLGVFVLSRTTVDPFSAREIELTRGFADQAVIAIENARLFEELRDRQAELRVTLDNTGDGVVMFDADFRLASWNHNFQEMLDVSAEFIAGRPALEDYVRLLAERGELGDGDPESTVASYRERATRQWSAERTRPDGRIVEVRNNPVPSGGAVLIYSDITERKRAEAEIRSARDAAQEALEQQTATAEILKVIASSPTDVQPVLDAVAKAAVRFCGATDATILLRDGDILVPRAHDGPLSYEAGSRRPLDRSSVGGRVTLDGRTFHVPDTDALDPVEFAITRRLVREHGFRAAVATPLRREDMAIGTIILRNVEPGAFTSQQIELLETFAAQAVIAIENVRLFSELRESLDQQTATAEILRVISQSPTDVAPVLRAVAKAALKFCGARDAQVVLRDGDTWSVVAHEGPVGALGGTRRLSGQTVGGRAMMEGVVVQIADLQSAAGDAFQEARELGARLGFRSALAAPLLRDGVAIGAISLRRPEAGAFTANQVELLESFAAQAVIAIENVRLFTELRDALEQQTATADILKAIASSPTDVQPVLDAVAKAAVRFCGTPDALVLMRDGDDNVVAAHQGALTATLGLRRPITGNFSGQALLEGRTLQIADVDELDAARYAGVLALARQHGWRASTAAPMMHAGKAIGCVVLRKPEPGLLSPRQIALLETFAAQAVIAIENVRLFTELRESLDQQAATSDVLKVIASSPTDVQPVLDAVAKAAQRFCGAADAVISLREGDEFVRAAHEGSMPFVLGRSALDRSSISGCAIVDARTTHIPDLGALDANDFAKSQTLAVGSGARAALAAPMLREGVAIGCILLRRTIAGPFAPKQIELLEAFAAQAVIAIENVRLFTELREALERQTATADILKAIANSPTDVQPVLDAVAKSAVRFCGAVDALITLRDGESWVITAHQGLVGHVPGARSRLSRDNAVGRAILDGATCHLSNVAALDPVEFASVRRMASQYGFAAVIAAPLLRDGIAIGAVLLRKPEPGPFTPQQVGLLETFAAQAVIAIENVRLFTELRDSLERLKAAQANLVQSEKMASLGQLTAGIAHEIKNPLNFVNNFAALSVELLEELKETAGAALATLGEDTRAEVDETMALLTGNLAKIAEHGKRADGIVKSMLSHSRGGTGDWTPSNVDALVEEALNLAYHGARAQDNEFNVTLERDLEAKARPIEVVPQDVTRVFLNLFGNGFYAVAKRRKAEGRAGYRPTLRVSTRDLGEAVEVRVRDNGTGIPPDVREKMFQPFFTTKPTGEGTGLGLSISYDIVTQQHGGTIEVESEPGSFTEFTVRLPRRRVQASERAR
ncbi:MAG: GAF domain-containing protein [Reyranellaceae bacterium]